MGRRSIHTTKSGKFMNPTDQARKEQRKRELKKNKKQRKMVREAVLKSKDPKKLLEEIEKIDNIEVEAGPVPLPNDKALKDKKKKLKETLDRMVKLVEKEDPHHYVELRRLMSESESRRLKNQMQYYESMKRTTEEEDGSNMPDIPLPPNIPLPHSGMLMPGDIPLPGAMPIPGLLPPGLIPPGPPPGPPPVLPPGLVPPGPPPGLPPRLPPELPPGPPVGAPLPPTAEDDNMDDRSDDGSSTSESGMEEEYDPEHDPDKLSDAEDLQPGEEPLGDRSQIEGERDGRPRQVRFADELVQSTSTLNKDDAPSGIQQFMLKMAGQRLPEAQAKANQKETGKDGTQTAPSIPPGPPPGPPPIRPPPPRMPIQPNFQIHPPPLGNPPRMFPPGPPPGRPPGPPPGMPSGPPGPPPGMPSGPPGPPPGLPPNMAAVMQRGPRPLMQQHMPPPPPRGMPLMRPPGPPPPGMMPPNQGAVFSAPPSVISKPPMTNPAADGGRGATISKEATSTISAKPQIRNTRAELTKLVPTALRVKREGPKAKPKPKNAMGIETLDNVQQPVSRPTQRVAATATKDDAYAQFMKEMAGLL